MDFNPWGSEEEKTVRKKHLETYTKFRQTAVEACRAKWGGVIPLRKIESYFSNGKFLNASGKEIYVRTNAHHRLPISFGGDNSQRTLIEKGFHNYIHQDFNQSQANVHQVLKRHNPKFESGRLPSEAKLRKFLIKRPDAVDDLNKLSFVRVSENGTLSVAILWPPEVYCIPSLLQFEHQNGGIYPTRHRNQDRGPHVPVGAFASFPVNILPKATYQSVHF